MSSHTWTPDALSSEFHAYDGRCWRLVESQHIASTMKLVDSVDEQKLLEDLIDATKPPISDSLKNYRYLLFTPFRYSPPPPKGSRFRRAGQVDGVFYGSERVETAVAEMGFFRVLFFAESPETTLPSNPAEYRAFTADISSDKAIDLTHSPFSMNAAAWTATNTYVECQALADNARAAGAEVIRYQSVRCPDGGANLAVLSEAAFASTHESNQQSWKIHVTRTSVFAICECPIKRLEFSIEDFANDDRIASWLKQAG